MPSASWTTRRRLSSRAMGGHDLRNGPFPLCVHRVTRRTLVYLNVHETGDRDPVLPEDEIFLVEMDPLDQGAEVHASLSDGDRGDYGLSRFRLLRPRKTPSDRPTAGKID